MWVLSLGWQVKRKREGEGLLGKGEGKGVTVGLASLGGSSGHTVLAAEGKGTQRPGILTTTSGDALDVILNPVKVQLMW